MEDQNNKKNLGLVELLVDLMKGNEDSAKLRAVAPNVSSKEIEDLSIVVKTLTTEFTVLAKSIAALAKIVHEHSLTINDLFTIQTYILQQMKDQSTDSLPPVIDKKKSDKSN